MRDRTAASSSENLAASMVAGLTVLPAGCVCVREGGEGGGGESGEQQHVVWGGCLHR